MIELTVDNAADYLRRRGWIGDGPVQIALLGGGVSNTVLRVETPDRLFVLKQSRPQLRTRDAWFSDLERVYREQEVMQVLAPHLPPYTVPEILFVDRANFVFAMAHAPRGAQVWKQQLLAGAIDFSFGEYVGRILGSIHEFTAKIPHLVGPFTDRKVFVQLRIDPFYYRIQERRPDVANAVQPLIDRLMTARDALCHGDYSPKNILRHEHGFTLVDYETAHLGDPSMDVGFFLSHLMLKAIKRSHDRLRHFELTRRFWQGYTAETTFLPHAELQKRGIEHCGLCLLARIDGTSPVEYLPEEDKRDTVRQLGRFLLLERPCRWDEVLEVSEKLLAAPLGKYIVATMKSRIMNTDPTITNIHAREVLDSRGNPTVEVEVHCAGGAWGRAIVPSGASTGRHEAVELRDGDLSRYQGKGVRRAVASVRDILAPRLSGMDATEQTRIDRLLCELDGTGNKSRLGANAILGVSLACAHAAAASRGQPLWRYLDGEGVARLPLPMVNLISGGLHAGGNLDLQDFLFMPIGARSYSESLEMAVAVYRALSCVLIRHGCEGVLVGDEGGFGPRLQSNEQAMEMILRAIEDTGLKIGEQGALALDVASTHFYREGRYHLRIHGGGALDAEGMIALLERWVKQYPIVSIEDGLAEDDWDGWGKLTAALGARVQLIGDDLFVTNPERLRRGIAEKVGNCVLVKVNQIGTLTEAFEVVQLARQAGYRAVVSARSGETEDNTLADLAVACGAGQIKIGSVARSERLAKYNQLRRIEEEMGNRGIFAVWNR